MQLFLQQIVEGLSAGAIYAALALALVLIYRATRIVNFAQGEMGTFTVFIAWQLDQWGVPFGLALIGAGVLSFILGIVVFRLTIRPVITASENTIVNICIGLFIGFEALSLGSGAPTRARFRGYSQIRCGRSAACVSLPPMWGRCSHCAFSPPR